MNRLDQIRQHRDAILRLAIRRGARHVRVFGSVARGEATSASDVDFLVKFDPDRSLLDHGGLLMDLQELLGCGIDLVDEDAMRPRFREHVSKEAVAL